MLDMYLLFNKIEAFGVASLPVARVSQKTHREKNNIVGISNNGNFLPHRAHPS